MPNEFAFRHRLDVRFRDCDAMGHVNNAVYLTYLEQSRFEFWHQITGEAGEAVTRGAAAAGDAGIIIARAEIDYRSPAHAGDRIEVQLGVVAIGRSSFTLAYHVIDERSGRQLAEARTVMVTYDYGARRPVPIPDGVRALLERARSSTVEAAPERPVRGS